MILAYIFLPVSFVSRGANQYSNHGFGATERHFTLKIRYAEFSINFQMGFYTVNHESENYFHFRQFSMLQFNSKHCTAYDLASSVGNVTG